MFGPTFMSIVYVVLKLEREGQSDPPVLPFSREMGKFCCTEGTEPLEGTQKSRGRLRPS